MRVALAAVAALAQDKLLPGLGEIGDGFFFHLIPLGLARAADHRADRDLDVVVLGTATMLVLPFPVTSALGADQWLKKQGHQAVDIMVRHKNDIAAFAAITTIRAATGNKFFPAKAAATISTIARFGMHANLINKFHSSKVADMSGQVESELEAQAF